jgi:hypothetical protein
MGLVKYLLPWLYCRTFPILQSKVSFGDVDMIVIVPADQSHKMPFYPIPSVSAVIFAYRNEMDLCIGITVGSAVQIALFVLPGSVLIGWVMDRAMSLFFRLVVVHKMQTSNFSI